MTTADRIALDALLHWSRQPLGKNRQRQVIISQQADRATVTLRFGEQYAITITRDKLSDAAMAVLAAAEREDK